MMQTQLMRMLKGLGCLALCFGLLSTGQTTWAVDFTADITEEIMNSHATGNIQVTGKGYRMDLRVKGEKGGEDNAIVIVDRRKGKTLLLDQKAKSYKEFENSSFLAFMVDPFQAIGQLEKVASKKMVGTEEVSGYVCDHYAYYDQTFKLADVWRARELNFFPIKAHMVSGRNDANIKVKTNWGATQLLLSNIRPGPVDVAVLAIPQGFNREVDPAEAKRKAIAALPAVKETVEGSAPWGRRIGRGGEIRVKVDPDRPVKIELRNLSDASAGAYTVYGKGDAETAAQSEPFDLPKTWQRKVVEFRKDKQTEWVFVRVDKGLVYAIVTNEKDPFLFSRDRQLEEGYITANAQKGVFVNSERKLTITVTGDSQDAQTSEITFTGCRESCDNKVLEEKITLANGKTKTWEFQPGHTINICNMLVGKSGGIKYRMEQPAQSMESARPSKATAPAAKKQTSPRIVRTQQAKPYGRSTKASGKKPGERLDKTDSGVIIKALNSGDVETVKAYLDEGMNANAIVSGGPLLQKAANLSTPEMVKLIIDRGGDLTYRSRSGSDALSQAQSNSNYWRELIPVLVEAGIPVNAETAIWKIAFKTRNGKFKPGARETLEYLLSKGADINATISKNGDTLLMNAAKHAWQEPVEFYLAHGADVNSRDKQGKTALDWANTPKQREKLYQQQQRKAIIKLLESKSPSAASATPTTSVTSESAANGKSLLNGKIPLMGGARVVKENVQGPMGQFVLQVSAPVSDVVDYYRKAMAEKGWPPGTVHIAGNKGAIMLQDGRRQFALRAESKSSGTKVILMLIEP